VRLSDFFCGWLNVERETRPALYASTFLVLRVLLPAGPAEERQTHTDNFAGKYFAISPSLLLATMNREIRVSQVSASARDDAAFGRPKNFVPRDEIMTRRFSKGVHTFSVFISNSG